MRKRGIFHAPFETFKQFYIHLHLLNTSSGESMKNLVGWLRAPQPPNFKPAKLLKKYFNLTKICYDYEEYYFFNKVLFFKFIFSIN